MYGDLGTLTYDFGADVVHAGQIGDRALHVVELTPDLETNWHVEDDFIAAVKSRGRINPHPDFEDGVRYMRVCRRWPTRGRAQRMGRDRRSAKCADGEGIACDEFEPRRSRVSRDVSDLRATTSCRAKSAARC